jgi:CRP-like cAMP-binding protein
VIAFFAAGDPPCQLKIRPDPISTVLGRNPQARATLLYGSGQSRTLMADRGNELHSDTSGPFSIASYDHHDSISQGMGGDSQNRVVDRLDAETRDLIEPHLQQVPLPTGQLLEQEGQPSSALYLPLRGGVSLELGSGKRAVQLTLIGRDGLIGTSLLLGGMALGTARVQFEGTAWRMSADALQACLEKSPQLHRHLLIGVSRLLARISRVAWASARGTVESRLAAWLLAATDCLEEDHITITHEAMSDVLGVRRPSVTFALHALEKKGIVLHRRGGLRVLDKQRLASIAGNCIGCNEV